MKQFQPLTVFSQSFFYAMKLAFWWYCTLLSNYSIYMEFRGIHWAKSNILPFIIFTTICNVRNLLTVNLPWDIAELITVDVCETCHVCEVRIAAIDQALYCKLTPWWTTGELRVMGQVEVDNINWLLSTFLHIFDLGILCWIYPRSSGDWSFTVYGNLLLNL